MIEYVKKSTSTYESQIVIKSMLTLWANSMVLSNTRDYHKSYGWLSPSTKTYFPPFVDLRFEETRLIYHIDGNSLRDPVCSWTSEKMSRVENQGITRKSTEYAWPPWLELGKVDVLHFDT